MDSKVKSIDVAEKFKVSKLDNFSWYRDVVKRILDFILSLFGIVILAIPMLIIALIIKLDSPKEKILFKQKKYNIRCKYSDTYTHIL